MSGARGLLDLPREVLVHILRFIELRDVPSVASACRLLHALRAEYTWHALARHVAEKGNACLDSRLDRLMGREQSAASVRLPRGRLLATDVANRMIVAACRYGRIEHVRLLLADPRVDPSVRSNAAIRWASEFGHADVVKLLLADPRVDPATMVIEAFFIAARNGHADVMEVLLRGHPGPLASTTSLGLQLCKSLSALPESLGNLTHLQKLDLSYCSSVTTLPKSLVNWRSCRS